MANFGMECSCGEMMTCEARSRDEAVRKIKGMMTGKAIAKHMKANHKPREPIPPQSQVYSMIEQGVRKL